MASPLEKIASATTSTVTADLVELSSSLASQKNAKPSPTVVTKRSCSDDDDDTKEKTQTVSDSRKRVKVEEGGGDDDDDDDDSKDRGVVTTRAEMELVTTKDSTTTTRDDLASRPLVTPDSTRSMIESTTSTARTTSSTSMNFWDSDDEEEAVVSTKEEENTSPPLRPEIETTTPLPLPKMESLDPSSLPDPVYSHSNNNNNTVVGLLPKQEPKKEKNKMMMMMMMDTSSDEDTTDIHQSSSSASSTSTGEARVKKEETTAAVAVAAPVPAVKPEIKKDPSAVAVAAADVKPEIKPNPFALLEKLKLDTNMLNDEDESSDLDDDELEILELRSPFAAQTDIKREGELEKFQSEEDKALQRLLWSLKFGDTLHPHQTMAVRRVAGLPDRFPLHQSDKGIKLAPELKYKMDISLAVLGLHKGPPTRGILLADEMGLGKTIESIAGMVLYNGLEEHRTRKKRPSLIVTPNRAVMEQWIEALTRNGVRKHRIKKFTKGMSINHNSDDFIVMEKSKLQVEIKAIFNGITEQRRLPNYSSLFPHVEMEEYRKLCTQYRSAQGKERNFYRKEKELPDDCVRRLVQDISKRMRHENKEPAFRTVVIDESHFLKNQLAYWGIAGLLLSVHSERAIPMSGTPYNNSVNDLAAAMGYIDVGLDSARNSFWVNALKTGYSREYVRDALKGWKEMYLVRRTKEETLKHLLGTKTIKREMVEQHPEEIFLQEYYENIIVKILDDFRHTFDEGASPFAVQEQKRMYSILMACISSARMAAIHPMLPSGREFTKHFSPSRRHMLSSETKKDVCVCCSQSLRPTIQIEKPDDDEAKEKAKEKAKERRRKIRQQQNIDDLDQDNLDDDDIDDLEREEDAVLLPLPASICKFATSECPHFAHEECLEDFLERGDSCPRCSDAARRLHFTRSDGTKAEVYCKGIEAIPGEPGFTVSSKLNQIVEHVRENVPKEDKVLILSFFKGSLDLLEGIFEEDLGIQCCRFDGDLGPTKANEDLDTFTTNPEKRILLATVQSGGTGLNIVEANHVLFVDRHFNPFTHAQAMDRCYRIGQKKDVFVHFFDGAGSIDEVMQMLNYYKSQNSKVILADGTELGANSGGNLSYQEVSGLLSRALQGICASRRHHIMENGMNAMIPASSSELIQSILNNSLETDFQAMFEALRGAQWGKAAEKDPSTAPMPNAIAEAILG